MTALTTPQNGTHDPRVETFLEIHTTARIIDPRLPPLQTPTDIEFTRRLWSQVLAGLTPTQIHAALTTVAKDPPLTVLRPADILKAHKTNSTTNYENTLNRAPQPPKPLTKYLENEYRKEYARLIYKGCDHHEAAARALEWVADDTPPITPAQLQKFRTQIRALTRKK